MAKTLGIWTPAGAILPASGAPGVVFTTGTNYTYLTLDFDQTSVESVYFFGTIPQSYNNGNVTVRVFWTATTTGNVYWYANYLGRVNDEVLDVALTTGSFLVDGVTAANDIMVADIAISTPTLAAGDWFVINLGRLASDGSDTLAADAKLLGIELVED